MATAWWFAAPSRAYCRAGYFSQCDRANPNSKRAGTAFFGGPPATGPYNGLQAEKARIPFAHVGLVKLPGEVSDDQAILISDIFPTGYFGADLAELTNGDTVAVFGCGPVGQFAIAIAKLKSAERIIAIDKYEDRLAMARRQGAETVNLEKEDPVQTGVYPPTAHTFPIGQVMNKSLTIKAGNCPHRRCIPMLVELVRMGAFDKREPGRLKVELKPER